MKKIAIGYINNQRKDKKKVKDMITTENHKTIYIKIYLYIF